MADKVKAQAPSMVSAIPPVMMLLEDLVPYENNPRKISQEAIDAVAHSIKKYGWKNDIVVDKDNVIIMGHTRRLAAMKLGLKEVPVKKATDLSEKDVQELRIIDNKSGEKAIWDFELLATELHGLDITQDVFTSNFSQFEFDSIFNADWETDLDKVEKTEASDDLARAKVSIECEQADKAEVTKWLEEMLEQAPFSNINVK